MTKHEENCTAPVCVDNPSDDTVWYAGEEICSKRPMNKIQKKQSLVNRSLSKGVYKLVDTPHTLHNLKHRAI